MHQVRFNGLSFATRPGRVMTPRRASEALVAQALERIGGEAATVVDVGTGSGSIAVAIAAGAPNAHVFATDTSRCAVALARLNVRRHGLCERVTVCHGDLLDPVPGPIDLVVAIQLHGRALAATVAELPALGARLERSAPALRPVPSRATA